MKQYNFVTKVKHVTLTVFVPYRDRLHCFDELLLRLHLFTVVALKNDWSRSESAPTYHTGNLQKN